MFTCVPSTKETVHQKILHLIVNEYFISHNLPLSHPYNFINTTTLVNTTNEGEFN